MNAEYQTCHRFATGQSGADLFPQAVFSVFGQGDRHEKRIPNIDRSQFHRYCEVVENITVSVDEKVYHAARVAAAPHKTWVSALVSGYLSAVAQGQAPVLAGAGQAEERKNRERLASPLRECKRDLGYKPSRVKTYEGGRFSRF
jgi:hypothetical protein